MQAGQVVRGDPLRKVLTVKGRRVLQTEATLYEVVSVADAGTWQNEVTYKDSQMYDEVRRGLAIRVKLGDEDLGKLCETATPLRVEQRVLELVDVPD